MIYPFLFTLLSIITPLLAVIFFRRKYHFPLKPVVIGAVVWIVTTQILEKILHVIVLTQTPLSQHAYLFAAYGGLAAGLFEETGRYVAFKYLLPRYRQWRDGLAYGLGHGGGEAIVISLIIGALMLSVSQMSGGELAQLKEQLSTTGMLSLITSNNDPVFWLLGFAERVMAIFMQVGLSFLVLYSITSKKRSYFFLAILLHALFDIPAALYQQQIISLPLVELVLFVIAGISFFFVRRSRQFFKK